MRASLPLFVFVSTLGCVEEGDWGEPRPDDDSAPVVGDDDDSTAEPTPDVEEPMDSDGDGTPDAEDCAPGDATVSPSAQETCNGVDDDCDNIVDEGLSLTWYPDADADGYGAAFGSTESCTPPSGAVLIPGDCDDADTLVHPGSSERFDGRDADCDGQRDWYWELWVTADDAFEFCVDDENVVLGTGTDWTIGHWFGVWLESGDHVLGIKGWDTGMVITAAIAHASISDGTQWVSDGTWRYDPNPANSADSRSGWCGPYFDDSMWSLAQVIGPAFTTSPWVGAPNGFPATTPASWIWDHYPVNLNTQYLRKAFTLP